MGAEWYEVEMWEKPVLQTGSSLEGVWRVSGMMARGGWVTSGGSLRLGGSRLPFRHLLGAEVIDVVKEDVGWLVARRCLSCYFSSEKLARPR